MAADYTGQLGEITLGYFQLGEVADAAPSGDTTFTATGTGTFAALAALVATSTWAGSGTGTALFLGAGLVLPTTLAASGSSIFTGIGDSVTVLGTTFSSTGLGTALWLGLATSIGMPDGEVTGYFNHVGTIQYLMPVGYILDLNRKNAGAQVTPHMSPNA